MSWLDEAACKLPPEDWEGERSEWQAQFHDGRRSTRDQARAVCLRCPVWADCLAYAVGAEKATGIVFSTWGGLSQQDRRVYHTGAPLTFRKCEWCLLAYWVVEGTRISDYCTYQCEVECRKFQKARAKRKSKAS